MKFLGRRNCRPSVPSPVESLLSDCEKEGPAPPITTPLTTAGSGHLDAAATDYSLYEGAAAPFSSPVDRQSSPPVPDVSPRQATPTGVPDNDPRHEGGEFKDPSRISETVQEPTTRRENEKVQHGREAPTTSQSLEKGHQPQLTSTFAMLRALLEPERRLVTLSVGALAASTSVTLALPRLLGNLVNRFGGAETATEVLQAASTANFELILASLIVGAVASGLRIFLLNLAAERVAFRLRIQIFNSLLRKPMTFFEKTPTADLTTRLTADVQAVSRGLLDLSYGVRCAATCIAGTALVALVIPSELISSLLLPVIGAIIFAGLYGKISKRLGIRSQERLASVISLAAEKLSGIRVVQAFNAESLELLRFKHELDKAYRVALQACFAAGGRAVIFYTTACWLLLHLIYRCGLLISSGVLSLGDVTSLVLYLALTGGAAEGIIAAYGDVQKAMGAASRLVALVDFGAHGSISPGAPSSQPNGNSPNKAAAQKYFPTSWTSDLHRSVHESSAGNDWLQADRSIRFDDVWFYYPSRPNTPALAGLSLEIPSNAMIAIMGESGCGKSTLAALLLRFYDPTKGKIYVGGEDLTSVPPAVLRAHIATVQQDNLLFSLPVKQNVLYDTFSRAADSEIEGRSLPLEMLSPKFPVEGAVGSTSWEKNVLKADKSSAVTLQRALEMSNSIDFVAAISGGVTAMVGDCGTTLSGGQRQRLCIARSLAKQPKVLLLDEATSALDLHSEQLLCEALRKSTKALRQTCVLITHRFSVARHCDLIVIMNNGTVEHVGYPHNLEANLSPSLKMRLLNNSEEQHNSAAPSSIYVAATAA